MLGGSASVREPHPFEGEFLEEWDGADDREEVERGDKEEVAQCECAEIGESREVDWKSSGPRNREVVVSLLDSANGEGSHIGSDVRVTSQNIFKALLSIRYTIGVNGQGDISEEMILGSRAPVAADKSTAREGRFIPCERVEDMVINVLCHVSSGHGVSWSWTRERDHTTNMQRIYASIIADRSERAVTSLRWRSALHQYLSDKTVQCTLQ